MFKITVGKSILFGNNNNISTVIIIMLLGKNVHTYIYILYA